MLVLGSKLSGNQRCTSLFSTMRQCLKRKANDDNIQRNDHNICISQKMLGCWSNNAVRLQTLAHIFRNMLQNRFRLLLSPRCFLFLALFLCYLIQKTNSINCYECTSSQGADCVYSATSCQYGLFGCVKIAILSGGVDKSEFCFF